MINLAAVVVGFDGADQIKGLVRKGQPGHGRLLDGNPARGDSGGIHPPGHRDTGR
jgi:hypothetical protein